MSKKKSFSGSTMTLKDFHGGSIPSDLPLPSAPGASARPPDRWVPPIRPDPRARPGSAGGGGTRLGSGFAIDDRGPPFLSTPANIGRHFDEDERKPFDATASPFPRRSAQPPSPLSDPAVRSAPVAAPARSDPKPQPRPAVGPTTNAWGMTRREEIRQVVDPVRIDSVENLSSRFAQASAIDKISSGRWQSKPITPPSPNVEAARFQETVMAVEEVKEVKERGFYNEGVRPGSNEGRFGGGGQLIHHHQQQVGMEVDTGERPKLTLLARTKMMDAHEHWAFDEKQAHQPIVDPVRIENSHELQGSMNMPRPGSSQGSMNMPRPGSSGADVGGRASERPRLNLKPRSLPVEQSVEGIERQRKSVFGGARPRELVLKERGIDDIVAPSQEVTSPENRAINEYPKTDMKPKLDPPAQATRRDERPESFQAEQRSRRDFERKDFQSNHEKVDNLPRASWRNDNWKNIREDEKIPERRPEPDTWRKPVDPPKPEPSVSASHNGKRASPLELAQAFSSARSDNSFPGRIEVPFSRLTAPRQINGY